jgi:hypothetical protein
VRKIVTIYRGGLQPPVRVAFDGPDGAAGEDDEDEGLGGLAGRGFPPLKSFGRIGTDTGSDPGTR